MTLAKPAVQTFGKYQILERIATGGMAEIYKARLEGIGGFQRTFAIKRILPHLSMNAEYVKMLVDEAKVAGLLSHANIVQILDLGQVDKVWYIAMEYVDGNDLGAVLKRAAEGGLRLPVPHACFIAIELLKGLEYAHQRQVMRGGRPVPLNIIHRDVSPPNILLSFQGEVKLTDFGIARAALKAQETQAGVIKGRFDYMSPEQAAGAKDLDQRSDLFAVGVVLYEMLGGSHPFRAESEMSTLEAVRTGKYIPVDQLNPEVPFQLNTIVDKCLRVKREERFATATAFKEALDRFFHESGFVFTHTTLASYIKRLFPKSRRGNGGRNSSLSPRPLEPRDDLDGPTEESITDGPTKLVDQSVVAAEMRKQGIDPGRFGLAPSEEATQIRKNPLFTSSPNNNIKEFEEADEQPTVIRGTPLTPLPGPEREESPDTDGKDWSTVSNEIPEAVRQRAEDAKARRVASQPRGVSLPVVAFIVFVVSGLGFIAGAFLGGGAVGIVAATAPREAPPNVANPTLRIEAPASAKIQVDGAPEKGNVPIELIPDLAHTVVVTLEGHEPFEKHIKLRAGEVRVLMVAPATPKAKPTP